MHATPGYHHVTIVEAGRTAYLARQCPLDADGRLVGPDDVAAQVDQVVANALVALETAEATPDDVVRSVVYVRSDDRAELAAAWQRLLDSPLALPPTS